jgi:hypothetical protein
MDAKGVRLAAALLVASHRDNIPSSQPEAFPAQPSAKRHVLINDIHMLHDVHEWTHGARARPL